MLFTKKSLSSSIFFAVCLLFTPKAFGNLPYATITLPSDNRSHADNPKVMTEWWYYTGKLVAEPRGKGKEKHFAYTLNLRYTKNIMGKIPEVIFQIIDLDDNRIYANTVLLTDGQMETDRLYIASRQFLLEDGGGAKKYHIKLAIPTSEGNISLDLELKPEKKPLFIGLNPAQSGLIDMGNGTNSFYYSITRLQTEGTIHIANQLYSINPDPCYSRSWMDHQWGDFHLADIIKNKRWFWIGLQLSDGTDINIGKFVPRESGSTAGEAHANISMPNGRSTYTTALITQEIDENHTFKGYKIQIDDKFYHLHFIKPKLSKSDIWMSVMSVNGRSILEPNASFAIVENTIENR